MQDREGWVEIRCHRCNRLFFRMRVENGSDTFKSDYTLRFETKCQNCKRIDNKVITV